MRFAPNIAWILVETDAQKTRMPELSVHGPLDEPNLHDDLGPNPVPAPRQALATGERRLLSRKSVEAFSQIEQKLRIEAGANLAGKGEVVAVVASDEQRAEADAGSLRIGESADDEFLRRFDLHLEPVLRASMFVWRATPLRDHAFPAFASCAIPRLCLVDELDALYRRLEGERLQQRAAFFDRQGGDG